MNKPYNQTTKRQCLHSLAPALPAVKYREKTFDGRVFEAESIYKGAPSPELDAAWERISQVKPFVLSGEEVEKVRKKKENVVKVGDEGYLANL